MALIQDFLENIILKGMVKYYNGKLTNPQMNINMLVDIIINKAKYIYYKFIN